ncbi:hypothetical protein E4U13_000969 [Claviceps humidiphila]|uniref:Uncharacterized protein n=1 Tax=Claviceps humidiphila TaxID=1294629 RepID=A0A9P7Q3C5_9HYPO|nr:hypothetical protein E4U13_000969 [Claviceps humidiphila]
MDNIETKPPADLSAEYQRGSAIADHRTTKAVRRSSCVRNAVRKRRLPRNHQQC